MLARNAMLTCSLLGSGQCVLPALGKISYDGDDSDGGDDEDGGDGEDAGDKW